MNEYKSTTALRKISALKKRIWVIQGGQGAGKTISILLIIINHVLSNFNKEVYIISEELSKMKITVIKDFLKIIKSLGVFNAKEWNKSENIWVLSNGSFIKFIGLDKEDLGKGLRSDLVFVNEANKIKFEAFRELTSRAKKVIIDYNPNLKFWANTEIIPREDADYLELTYLDNEHLSQTEVNEILSYKEKGYDKQGNIINQYWANKWQIYGLGKVGGVEGRIFNWTMIPDRAYEDLDVKKYYYADWGTQDPFAIGEVKYFDGGLYVKELNYKSENEWRMNMNETQKLQISGKNDDGFVTWLFERLGIDKRIDVIADSNRPLKIIALRNAGWERAVGIIKKQGSIIDGIDLLQNINVYFTQSSKNIDHEQNSYHWKTDKSGIQIEEPEDADNHHMDGIRYVAQWLQIQGVIRKV